MSLAVPTLILRGNGGQAIFFSGGDYTRWFPLVEEGVERFGHRVHGYCCMTNPVHLAMQVGERPPVLPARDQGFRCTRWIDRRWLPERPERTGRPCGYRLEINFQPWKPDPDSSRLPLCASARESNRQLWGGEEVRKEGDAGGAP